MAPQVNAVLLRRLRSYGISELRIISTLVPPSHAVAGKHLLAALAQLGPVLLQALLNRSIIAQLLSAKALRISSTGLLLLRRAHVPLCKRWRSLSQQND
jgi:hypothetical protein